MLCSPDPPNYPDSDIGSEIISEITMGGEESEDASADSGDELPGQINYYQLLPQDISSGESNGNGHSIAEEDYSLEHNEPHTAVNGAEATLQTPTKERTDIEVNDEEVRAAMQNIILPPSAIPPWAVNVPESQWTAFLLSRITNLRTNNKS
ncbi:uncharacterized protein [Halyomorpha halys]|uniref:uncharacterized protein n=1 Tax=Halyomorpha halys TaxID=286706 RepID=UPI0006D4FA20|nr:uncharacterized protein LOC106685754 [Halyomorpha halys]